MGASTIENDISTVEIEGHLIPAGQQRESQWTGEGELAYPQLDDLSGGGMLAQLKMISAQLSIIESSQLNLEIWNGGGLGKHSFIEPAFFSENKQVEDEG